MSLCKRSGPYWSNPIIVNVLTLGHSGFQSGV